MNIGAHPPRSASDWRLSTSPFWFKFVRDDAFKADDPVVLKGMYVSAGFLRLAIQDGSLMAGSRGGFEVMYGNTKYIRRDMFVDLVRRGLIGTNASETRQVSKIIDELSRKDEIVVAIKQPADM
jgi:hypothetical protein